MASVGGSRSSDKPIRQCDPCARSGLVKKNSTYCEQCEEYMCETCASIHSGLKLARNHTMVSGSYLVLTGQSGTKKLSLSYCAKHGDKEIEWFCKKHEAMFCNTCKIIEHRKCEIMPVSDKSASEYGKSLADAIGSLESLKSRIVNLKSAREKSVEDLVNLRKSCESAVQKFKSTIIEKVERMEKEILAEVNKVVTTETAAILDHVNTCDTLIPQLELQLITADEATRGAGDVTSAIAANKLSNMLKTLEPTVSDLEQEVYDVHIIFQPSRQLTDVFSEIYQLGTLEIDRTETAGVDRTVDIDRTETAAVDRTVDIDRTETAALDRPVAIDRTETAAVYRTVAIDRTEMAGVDRTMDIDRTETAAVDRTVDIDRTETAAVDRPVVIDRTETVTVDRTVAIDRTETAAVDRTVDIDRTETADVDRPKSAAPSACPVSGRTSWLDMKVVWSTKINVKSDVTGSAVMSDGRLILTNYSNKQIILLNQDFKIQSTLTLPGKPMEVAVYGDNAAVLSMPSIFQLQYIHVDTTLRAGRAIPIGLPCYGGVGVHDGKIYVGVFNAQYRFHIQVMDTRGNVTRRIGHDTDRCNMYRDYMTIGTGGTIYISHPNDDRITCYTNAGDVVYDVQHECMSGPGGMVVDEDDNLLVCCYGTNTIHVLGKDGAHLGVMKSSADGLVYPRVVSYRRSDQMLIVTMEKKHCRCRAYKLK